LVISSPSQDLPAYPACQTQTSSGRLEI
jgi:hypothetical protein